MAGLGGGPRGWNQTEWSVCVLCCGVRVTRKRNTPTLAVPRKSCKSTSVRYGIAGLCGVWWSVWSQT